MLGSESEDDETAFEGLALSSPESVVQADRATPVQRAPVAQVEVPKKLRRFMGDDSWNGECSHERTDVLLGLPVCGRFPLMFVRGVDSNQRPNRGGSRRGIHWGTEPGRVFPGISGLNSLHLRIRSAVYRR